MPGAQRPLDISLQGLEDKSGFILRYLMIYCTDAEGNGQEEDTDVMLTIVIIMVVIVTK